MAGGAAGAARGRPARVGGAGAAPAGGRRLAHTLAWLHESDARARYFVHPWDERELRSLARQVTGRAVGLLPGGTGARGFAHIGLIRAPEELRIPVDLAGGTLQCAAEPQYHFARRCRFRKGKARCSMICTTVPRMSRSLHVRLDDASAAALDVVRSGGMTDSEAVRTALREAAARRRASASIREEVRRLASDEADRDEMRIVREHMAELAPRTSG
jgi:hypothetical protein